MSNQELDTIYAVFEENGKLCGCYTIQVLAEEAAKLFAGTIQEVFLDSIPEHPEGTYRYRVELNYNFVDAKIRMVYYARGRDGEIGVLLDTYVVYVWAKDEVEALGEAKKLITEDLNGSIGNWTKVDNECYLWTVEK